MSNSNGFRRWAARLAAGIGSAAAGYAAGPSTGHVIAAWLILAALVVLLNLVERPAVDAGRQSEPGGPARCPLCRDEPVAAGAGLGPTCLAAVNGPGWRRDQLIGSQLAAGARRREQSRRAQ